MGDRFSAGAPYSADAWGSLAAYASETVSGGSLQGVVAVEALVPDRDVLDRVAEDDRVFAVDLSAAIAKDASGLDDAPALNDLYWYVAGWEPVD